MSTISSDIRENLTCPICIGTLKGPVTEQKCYHTFCETCLKSWADLTNSELESPWPLFTCPLSRKPCSWENDCVTNPIVEEGAKRLRERITSFTKEDCEIIKKAADLVEGLKEKQDKAIKKLTDTCKSVVFKRLSMN